MGDITGFLKYDREELLKADVKERISNWNEFTSLLPESNLTNQAARCMDCGVPFCHNGCPVNNLIPDWNDLVYKRDWFNAFNRLMKTNNFPEFTGRVCPAPCENSCVLAITKPAVSIKNIELAIIEKAYDEGWMKAMPPSVRSGKKVAIIGSGPAGLACADQLNKRGHFVTVFEKNSIPGGLLTIGIPNFKLDKKYIKRRISLMEEEGIEFKTNITVGEDIIAEEIISNFDAVVLACGAEQPRDLPIDGRELEGIYFAMDYLGHQAKVNLGLEEMDEKLSAKGKNVIVLGGGDTGADCIGTAIRQGAKSVKNFELMPQPPLQRTPDNPWPQWARILRISTSHEEGCEREYCVLTKQFIGENGKVSKLKAVRVNFTKGNDNGRMVMEEIPDSDFEVDADMVILALGFIGPAKGKLLEQFNVQLDERGNVKTDDCMMTSKTGVFSAGDMRRGQSLVVWAINEGRKTADYVNKYLKEIS